MARTSVKVTNAALDEVVIDKIGTQIVLRGVLDNDSLDLLQIDAYQREILPQSKIMDLIEGMKTGIHPGNLSIWERDAKHLQLLQPDLL